MTENGYQDKGVKLTTQRTSKLADMVHKPIAAGNLFIGQFDATDALRDAMKATKFGHPFSFSAKPAKLEGWYKYQAGEKFTDKNMQELDRHDYGTIYAVLYENIDEKGNAVLLYGDNVQTSKQIVALALVGETQDDNGKVAIGNTPEWHHFSVDFEYKKTIDPIKLKNGGYSLAIVSSSSSDGANFLGADDLVDYAAREETRHEHLAELRGLYGFRTFSGRGASELKEWLFREAEMAVSNEDIARRFVAECRRTRTVLPATSTIERLCAAALVDAERRIETRIASRLPMSIREQLLALLEETADEALLQSF
jgi:hypothetical protein